MNQRGINNYNNSEELHDKIHELLYVDMNYQGAYYLSELWIKKIEYENLICSAYQLWVSYYYLGVANWGLAKYQGQKKKYQDSIDTLSKSLKFTIEQIDKIRSKIMIASCYQDMGIIKKALNIYNECLRLCNNKNELTYKKTKASLLNNMGEALKQEQYYYDSIKIFEEIIEEIYLIDESSTKTVLNKIDNNYKELYELYISKHDQLSAKRVIEKIHNIELRQNLNKDFKNRNKIHIQQ